MQEIEFAVASNVKTTAMQETELAVNSIGKSTAMQEKELRVASTLESTTKPVVKKEPNWCFSANDHDSDFGN